MQDAHQVRGECQSSSKDAEMNGGVPVPWDTAQNTHTHGHAKGYMTKLSAQQVIHWLHEPRTNIQMHL